MSEKPQASEAICSELRWGGFDDHIGGIDHDKPLIAANILWAISIDYDSAPHEMRCLCIWRQNISGGAADLNQRTSSTIAASTIMPLVTRSFFREAAT